MKIRMFAATAGAAAVMVTGAVFAPAATAIDLTVEGDVCTITTSDRDRLEAEEIMTGAHDKILENLKQELPSVTADIDAVIAAGPASLLRIDGEDTVNIDAEMGRINEAALAAGFGQGEIFRVFTVLAYLSTPGVITELGSGAVTKEEAAQALPEIRAALEDFANAGNGGDENEGIQTSEQLTRVMTPYSEAMIRVISTFETVHTACVDGEEGTFRFTDAAGGDNGGDGTGDGGGDDTDANTTPGGDDRGGSSLSSFGSSR